MDTDKHRSGKRSLALQLVARMPLHLSSIQRVAFLALSLCVTSCTSFSPGQEVAVKIAEGRAPAGYVEVGGVGAGAFDPALWEAGTLNLLPDLRSPLLTPPQGRYRNIYAPSAVETSSGYQLFYGAWDGIPEGKDRIYRGETDFDFSNVTNRHTVVLPGSYHHICNVNAIRLGDGTFGFVATTYPLDGLNKPAFFRSDSTGTNWNGSRGEPVNFDPRDLMTITGYTNLLGEDAFPGADINGLNVILQEEGFYRLYFGDFKNTSGNGPFQIYRASSSDGKNYRFEGNVLPGGNAINDAKKFRVGTNTWYLLGTHHNRAQLSYSLSTNALSFPPVQTLLTNVDSSDRFIVALGWVVQGEQEKPGRKLLGVLYGAGPAPSLDQNKIFARWLQKKVVFVSNDGRRYEGKSSHGPNRQLIPFPENETLSGFIEVYAEDGITLLGRSGRIRFESGKRFQMNL